MAEMSLANYLKLLRDDSGFTQQKLGDQLQISRQLYSFYETGRRLPSLEVLDKLAEIYNIPLSYFFKKTDLTPRMIANGSVLEALNNSSIVKDADEQEENLLYEEFVSAYSEINTKALPKWADLNTLEQAYYFSRLSERDKKIVSDTIRNMLINK